MIEYNAKYINGAPDWESLDKAPISNPYLNTPDNISAYAQLCYDDNQFYLHFVKTEPSTLIAQSGELGAPCQDSCLEFFFSPINGDKRYINIEFNASGCVYFGVASNIPSLLRLTAEGKKTSELFCPKAAVTNTGWELFYTVPFELVKRLFPGFDITKQDSMLANFFTCADDTTPPHYLSWSKIEGEPFTFHKQHCFGKINFVK